MADPNDVPALAMMFQQAQGDAMPDAAWAALDALLMAPGAGCGGAGHGSASDMAPRRRFIDARGVDRAQFGARACGETRILLDKCAHGLTLSFW